MKRQVVVTFDVDPTDLDDDAVWDVADRAVASIAQDPNILTLASIVVHVHE